MPSGRLPKRPADLGEFQDNSFGTQKAKLPRLERDREDFSQVVKDRLQFNTRIGQACDRCKVRKIRCDGLPEGCSTCAQQNLECYVTDRVTGRTERRGYLQELEREKRGMINRINDLEKLLDDKGVQVRPQQWTPPYRLSTTLGLDSGPNNDQWTQFFSLWIKDASRQADKSLNDGSITQQASSLETADQRTADTNRAPLCSINGTQQSIRGTTMDIASINSPDVDCPLPDVSSKPLPYVKPLQSFGKVSEIDPPASQFASRHNVAVKQGRFGAGEHMRPPSRSKSSTMVNRTHPSFHRAPSMEKVPYYSHSMTASTAYPQIEFAGSTQSIFSTPTSPPSFVQSSYIEGSANHHLCATSAEASASVAQMNRTVYTRPENSPEAVPAAHNHVVAYNSPQQIAAVQPYPAEWMNSCSRPAHGILTAQQVPNEAESYHPTTPTHSWHWTARRGSGDQGRGRVGEWT